MMPPINKGMAQYYLWGSQNPPWYVLAWGMCLWFQANPLITDVKIARDVYRQDS